MQHTLELLQRSTCCRLSLCKEKKVVCLFGGFEVLFEKKMKISMRLEEEEHVSKCLKCAHKTERLTSCLTNLVIQKMFTLSVTLLHIYICM